MGWYGRGRFTSGAVSHARGEPPLPPRVPLSPASAEERVPPCQTASFSNTAAAPMPPPMHMLTTP